MSLAYSSLSHTHARNKAYFFAVVVIVVIDGYVDKMTTNTLKITTKSSDICPSAKHRTEKIYQTERNDHPYLFDVGYGR